MLILSFHCSVCEGVFHTSQEWLEHLLKQDHQSKARVQVFNWGQAERDCAFIVFATFPIASEDVLLFFSGSSGVDSLVRDFVFFPNNPRVGFFMFDSK